MAKKKSAEKSDKRDETVVIRLPADAWKEYKRIRDENGANSPAGKESIDSIVKSILGCDALFGITEIRLEPKIGANPPHYDVPKKC